MMRHGMTILVAAGLIALAATTGARGRDARAVPVATPAGAPVDCVSIPRIRETRVHGDQVIDFVMAGGRVYRNTLPNACPSLGFEERFTYTTSLSQLCAVDTITVLQSMGGGLARGATCGLGRFQPVTLAPPARR